MLVVPVFDEKITHTPQGNIVIHRTDVMAKLSRNAAKGQLSGAHYRTAAGFTLHDGCTRSRFCGGWRKRLPMSGGGGLSQELSQKRYGRVIVVHGAIWSSLAAAHGNPLAATLRDLAQGPDTVHPACQRKAQATILPVLATFMTDHLR